MIHLISLNFEYLDAPVRIKHATMLVIERRQLFAKVIEAVYQYKGEDDYLQFFDTDYKGLQRSELMVVTDILGFDLNSAPVLKLIYHDLELQIAEKPVKKNKIEALLYEVTKLVNEELVEFDIDLASDEITFVEVLKALGVQVEVKTDTIFERLFELLQVFKYLSKKKLLVLVNAGAYLANEEIGALAEYAKLQNIQVLFLDPNRSRGLDSCYILDTDYCLSHEKTSDKWYNNTR